MLIGRVIFGGLTLLSAVLAVVGYLSGEPGRAEPGVAGAFVFGILTLLTFVRRIV
jgi:hypothetical protein